MKNLLFILLFIPLISFGQNNKGIQMCLALQSNGFISNLEAEEALDLIMNVSGLNKNFILAPCDNIENAYAIRFNNERYIIYDKDFMDEIDGGSKWRNLTILAHEVAHHLNNHPLEVRLANSADRKSLAEKRRQELEADEFAGFIMARLDGPLKEVLAAVSSISNNKDDTYSTHPSRDKRINAIRKGYKRAGYIENFSWFNWEVPDFFKKIQNIFLGESDNKIEKKEKTNEKVYSNRNTFKITTTDLYIEHFGKNPDYGNHIDVSSSYYTNEILFSRTTEVLNEPENERYGKLYEGLSYVNRRIQIDASWVEYSHRTDLNFYLGDYQNALNDSDKYLTYSDLDFSNVMYHKKLRSQIKYMLGDYIGAINNLNQHYDYFKQKDTSCEIDTYYWFIVYHLATNDYSNAAFYLDKVNTYPSYNRWCGDSHINNVKSKANKLTAYIRN